MVPAILSDIIDYSSLRYKTDSVATYFSIQTFTYKFVMSIGSAVSLGLAGWFGFDVSLAVQNSSGDIGILMASSWIPTALAFVAFLLAFAIPINRKRHAIIRRKLDRLNV